MATTGGLLAEIQQTSPIPLDLSFFCPPGHVTALFGPSGSGKTTALRCIAGLLRPKEGRIVCDGETWLDTRAGKGMPVHRRKIGYVFQNYALFPHMSALGNVMAAISHRLPRRQRAERARQLLGLMQLQDLEHRRPAELSGGEQQRVAMARAIARDPKALLLDEPLAALDAARRAEILPYIERLRDDVRVPIIYVSHSIDEVARLADTIIILDRGRVVASGEVGQVMARLDLFPPDNPYEAGATIAARVAGHDVAFSLSRLAFEGGELVVPRVEHAVGSRLRVRIRARDIMLSLSPPAASSALNILPAIIGELRQEIGCYADVQIVIGGTHLIARITRFSAERLQLRPGTSVFALVKSVAIDGRGLGLLAADGSESPGGKSPPTAPARY